MNSRRHTNGDRKRRGITITEVVIAASGVSVLSVLGITVICLLMTAEQRAMESIVIDRSISELAHDLRQDAHSATTATLSDDQATLSLVLPGDETVNYTCTDDAVTRTDTTDRRDEFALPFGHSRFSKPESDRLITFWHEREPQQDMSLSENSSNLKETERTYRIDAALLSAPVDPEDQS
ncbi:MAG: hypothetical protein KDA93_08940 [Planctomycetaceae bacterium]|nr:hypothetical protein [Planctomycetaceae bacterium]